jgi:hypothetical protein
MDRTDTFSMETYAGNSLSIWCVGISIIQSSKAFIFRLIRREKNLSAPHMFYVSGEMP